MDNDGKCVASAEPGCPDGSHLKGGQCILDSGPDCPEGTEPVGNLCIAKNGPECTPPLAPAVKTSPLTVPPASVLWLPRENALVWRYARQLEHNRYQRHDFNVAAPFRQGEMTRSPTCTPGTRIHWLGMSDLASFIAVFNFTVEVSFVPQGLRGVLRSLRSRMI